MRQHHPRIRVALGLLPVAAVLLWLLGEGDHAAHAFIDAPPSSLSKLCAASDFIAVFRVEKVNRQRKGIVYRKVRDLKGTFPDFAGDTLTHVFGPVHNPPAHPEDLENQDLLTE